MANPTIEVINRAGMDANQDFFWTRRWIRNRRVFEDLRSPVLSEEDGVQLRALIVSSMLVVRNTIDPAPEDTGEVQ